MCDSKRPKKALIEELQTLRSRIAELEHIKTEHEQSEEALSDKTKALDAIITNLKQGIAYLDENDTIIYLNQQCADLFGLKYEDVFRKNVYAFHPPEKSGAVEALINEFKQGKQHLNIVETVGNKVLDDTFHRIQDGDGNYRGILMSVVDITVHKKAEEALIQSEEKYKSVIENIGIGVSLISPEMEILAMNRQLREWFPDVDVSKKPICYESFNKPVRRDICSYCPTYKSLRDGQVHEAITETPSGGRIVNYRIVSSPIKDKEGNVIAAIEMVDDITERKKAQEALKESEERYKALFESAAEGILVADIETKQFKYANPAFCRMLGYTEEEIGQMGVQDIHPEESLEYVMAEFEAQSRGEKTLAPNIPCLRKDGTIMYADIDTANVSIDGRECNVGFFTDITERKKAEDALQKARDQLEVRVRQRTAELADVVMELQNEISERERTEKSLRESESLYQSLVDVLPQCVYRTDLQGRITFGNKAYIAELDMTLDECIGKTAYDFFPKELAEKYTADDERVIQTGEVLNTVESHKVPSTGETLYVQVVKAPVRDRDGKVIGIEGIFWDITERRQAEEKLAIYQEQLRSLASELSLAEERLRRRIAIDLHDHISQNLAISKIKLESLRGEISSPELSGDLEKICDLIAQTIESTRSLTFEMSTPVLYELGFEAAVKWLVQQTRQKHGLSADFQDDGRAKPLHDDIRILLFQSVRELLANVVKHAKAHSVVVSTQCVGNEVHVCVEDDGVGFGASKPGAMHYEAGGFGLFSIRERLDRIGGRLDIESPPDKGTRVTLVAPISEDNRKGREKSK